MSLSIVVDQKKWSIGNIEHNASRIIETIKNKEQNDLIIFSELSLCGYIPEDLMLRNDFKNRCEQELENIKQASQHCGVVVGHPCWEDGNVYNSLSFFYHGESILLYHKQKLPNYDVFDEKRYFTPGTEKGIAEFKGYRLGFLICEDIWRTEPIKKLTSEKIDLLIVINASPYDFSKPAEREKLLIKRTKQLNAPIIYLCQVGGYDELIFDGQSLISNKQGEIVHRLPAFIEETAVITLNDQSDIDKPIQLPKPLSTCPSLNEIYDALVLSVKDYVSNNGFKGALLGLSGGIDSALTLAIAVDALGKDRVRAVMMPFRFTSEASLTDAKEETTRLGVKLDIISIDSIFDAFMNQLTIPFDGTSPDTTEENLQARCRGVILMALSNKFGKLVLTTGNKSELSVGYATLYGDMAGGFAVLSDVSKTLVYQLAQHRNTRSNVIPERVLTRAPSAELAPDQKDQDTLPPYDILDGILEGYVEKDLSVSELIGLGYEKETVNKVIKLVDTNEYKRWQSPVGPRITARNFSKGRRYPISPTFGAYNW